MERWGNPEKVQIWIIEVTSCNNSTMRGWRRERSVTVLTADGREPWTNLEPRHSVHPAHTLLPKHSYTGARLHRPTLGGFTPTTQVICHVDKQPRDPVLKGVMKYSNTQKMDSILLYWAVLWLRWLDMWCLNLSDKMFMCCKVPYEKQ